MEALTVTRTVLSTSQFKTVSQLVRHIKMDTSQFKEAGQRVMFPSKMGIMFILLKILKVAVE